MYFYFKDDSNGVGVTSDKETFVGDVTWITRTEFLDILAKSLYEEEALKDGDSR